VARLPVAASTGKRASSAPQQRPRGPQPRSRAPPTTPVAPVPVAPGPWSVQAVSPTPPPAPPPAPIREMRGERAPYPPFGGGGRGNSSGQQQQQQQHQPQAQPHPQANHSHKRPAQQQLEQRGHGGQHGQPHPVGPAMPPLNNQFLGTKRWKDPDVAPLLSADTQRAMAEQFGFEHMTK